MRTEQTREHLEVESYPPETRRAATKPALSHLQLPHSHAQAHLLAAGQRTAYAQSSLHFYHSPIRSTSLFSIEYIGLRKQAQEQQGVLL